MVVSIQSESLSLSSWLINWLVDSNGLYSPSLFSLGVEKEISYQREWRQNRGCCLPETIWH